MYTHRIPNHLETEDKFILNLNIRQCAILFVTFCMAYMIFSNIFNSVPDPTLALGLGLVGALLALLAGVALALIRIHYRGLDEWVFVLLLYAAQPKVYTWHFNKLDAFELFDLQNTTTMKQKVVGKEEVNEW